MQELLKEFNPDHYGYDSLLHASGAMSRIASHINEVKKRHENAMRVQVGGACLAVATHVYVHVQRNFYIECVLCTHVHVYMHVDQPLQWV